jgi:hypothetical protein
MSQSIGYGIPTDGSSPNSLANRYFEQLEKWCGLQEQYEDVDGVETVVQPEAGPIIVPVLSFQCSNHVGERYRLMAQAALEAQAIHAENGSFVRYQHIALMQRLRGGGNPALQYNAVEAEFHDLLPVQEFSVMKNRTARGANSTKFLDLNEPSEVEAACAAMDKFWAKYSVGGSIGPDKVLDAHVTVTVDDDISTIARAMAEILGPNR